MFAIVTFPEENDAPGIVSTNWIDKSRNICFYPNVKTELQKNKLLLGREMPKPDWTECRIKLLKEFASYLTAKEQLSEAELTSNLESEAEAENTHKKRPRKERVIVLPGESDSSEDEDRSCHWIKKTHKPKAKIGLFPPPPPPRPRPSHVSPKSSPIRSLPLNASPCSSVSEPLLVEIQEPYHSSSSSGSSSMHSSDLLQLKGNQELMWKCLGELSKTCERLENKMDRMISMMEAQPTHTREAPENSYLEEQLLAQLPMKVEDVDAFETKLKDPAVRQRLMKYLTSVGGKEVKAVATSLMRRLFMDEVGEKYSLTGKAGKEGPGKKPFIKTESFRLVYDLSLRKFRHAEESQIREAVSDWLMQAKFRRIRRENRQNKFQGPVAEEQEPAIE